MEKPDPRSPISRRRALALGGGLLGGLVGARIPAGPPVAPPPPGRLPVARIRDLLPAPASLRRGVLRLAVQRADIGAVVRDGAALSPAFALAGQLAFAPLVGRRAYFNGELPVRGEELQAVTAAIAAAGLELEAVHQRARDLGAGRLHSNLRTPIPAAWFVHWSGTGEALALARAAAGVLAATATVLPATGRGPAPDGRLDAERLRRILHGYDAELGADGVVSVFVARRHGIDVGGLRVPPEANLATKVSFQPLGGGGAAVAADFAMAPGEVNGVMRTMRDQGWDLGALYARQQPWLHSSHQLAAGDPYARAAQARRGLDQTDAA